MNGLVVWEWIINILAILSAIQIYRSGDVATVKGPFFRTVGIGTVLAFAWMYLWTMLLFGWPLTWNNDLNISGDNPLIDPWQSFWDFGMHWWMWILFLAAFVCYLVARKRPKGWALATRIIAGISLVLAILGIQVNNPFADSAPPAAAVDDGRSAKEICDDLLPDIKADLALDKEYRETRINPASDAQRSQWATDAKSLGVRLIGEQEDMASHGCLSTEIPTVGLSWQPVVTGYSVHMELTTTNMTYPQFSWSMKVIGQPDDVSTHYDPTLTFEYPPIPAKYYVQVTAKDGVNPGRTATTIFPVTVPDGQVEAIAATTASAAPVATSAPTTPAAPACPDSWPMTAIEHTNGDLLPGGVKEILEASGNQQALDAANVWLERIKTDPINLVGVYKYLSDVSIDPASIVDANGCASANAENLFEAMKYTLDHAKSITAEPVPTDARNSHVVDGKVVPSDSAGIDGDLRSIKIVLSNNKTVWILGRCGNPATLG